MTGANIEIRDMSEDDLNDVIEIYKGLVDEDRMLSFSHQNYSIGGQMGLSKVAELDGKLVGFILGRRQPHPHLFNDVGNIIGIGILRQAQRQGVASKMVKAFVENCQAKKISMVTASINTHDRPMQAFYKALGFGSTDMIELSVNTSAA